jgi:hypothetical protein
LLKRNREGISNAKKRRPLNLALIGRQKRFSRVPGGKTGTKVDHIFG